MSRGIRPDGRYGTDTAESDAESEASCRFAQNDSDRQMCGIRLPG